MESGIIPVKAISVSSISSAASLFIFSLLNVSNCHSLYVLQVIDGVMRQLLSKDLMYEPTKQICDKFPEWLANNK